MPRGVWRESLSHIWEHRRCTDEDSERAVEKRSGRPGVARLLAALLGWKAGGHVTW